MSQPLPQGEQKRQAVQAMFDTIAPRYDLVNRLMTFGMDRGWRKKAVASLGLPMGSAVLDIACGTGDLCRDLQAGGYRPVGVDLSDGMLGHARTSASLILGDALAMPVADASLKGAVSGFALRNFVELPAFFTELARVVAPGGRIALLDVCAPPNRLLRVGYNLYFGRMVPIIGGLLSDRAAYGYLPRSLAYLPDPQVMLEELEAAGFVNPRRRLLAGGLTQLISATRA